MITKRLRFSKPIRAGSLLLAVVLLSGCLAPGALGALPAATASLTAAPPAAPVPTGTPVPSATARPLVPDFKYIIIVVFENKEFGAVVPNDHMPYFNKLATAHTLLTQYFAVAHPSLPNYLAMIGGDTFGVTFDCTSCPVQKPSLPDLIEASGRSWKTYQEDMPSPCFSQAGAGNYAMKHNPFIYFMPIRLAPERCERSIVPFSDLATDLAAGALPDFSFITPNMCNDAHDCDLSVADAWLKRLMSALIPALDGSGQPYLVVLTWDEGQGDHSCCGLPPSAGGRVATILVSPQAKSGFQDATPYTHYSLLKTISVAWNLAELGHASDAQTTLISAPWK